MYRLEDVDVGISVASLLKVYVYWRSVLRRASERDRMRERKLADVPLSWFMAWATRKLWIIIKYAAGSCVGMSFFFLLSKRDAEVRHFADACASSFCILLLQWKKSLIFSFFLFFFYASSDNSFVISSRIPCSLFGNAIGVCWGSLLAYTSRMRVLIVFFVLLY